MQLRLKTETRDVGKELLCPDMASRRRPAGGAKLRVVVRLLFPPPLLAAAALPSFDALGGWSTVVSLTHSLMLRVADVRAEKGDLPGAAHARGIAHKVELLYRITSRGIVSTCWDYSGPPPLAAAALPLFDALERWSTVFSLIHSLMLRVADVRAEKGDLPGAARARGIAHKLELLDRIISGGIVSTCWEYVRNYDRRDGAGLGAADEIYRAAGELVAALQEFGRMGSGAERARWAGRNYANLVSAANTALRRLSQAFSRSGALKETVLMWQEVVDRELWRDCLQVGAGELEGLLRVARDLPGAARGIAHKLELFDRNTSGGIVSTCWDYVRNYDRRDGAGLGAADEIYRAAGELVAAPQEFGRMGSGAERARWAGRNYANLVSAANTALRRLSQAFLRSGGIEGDGADVAEGGGGPGAVEGLPPGGRRRAGRPAPRRQGPLRLLPHGFPLVFRSRAIALMRSRM